MKPSTYLFCLLVCHGAVLVLIDASPVQVPSMDNIQLSVTQKGLDYANAIFKAGMISEIEGLKTENVKNSAFWTTLELIQPTVKKVVLQSSSIRFHSGLVKMHALLKAVEVTGHYKFSTFFSSSNGDFSSSMSQITVVLDISLGRTNDGKIEVRILRCKTTIPADTMNNQFKGGSSFLLNIGVSLLKNYVKSNIESKICSAVEGAIKTRSGSYSNLYTEAFNFSQVPCASLQYTVARSPEIKHSHVDMMLQGNITSSCTPPISMVTAHVSKATLVNPQQDKMVTLALSDPFINTLFNVYYQKDLFSLSMNINKTSLQAQVSVKPTSQPIITTISGNSSMFSMNATVQVNKNTTAGPLILNNDSEIKGEIVFKVDQSRPRKSLSAQLINLRADYRNSTSVVKKFVEVINQKFVNQALHSVLNDMIPLPMVGKIALVNPQITYHKGQVILASDVNMY